ncbi:MAG: hypothetical protein R2863_06895 [Candidatus Kapaibacterium sp.]
MRKIILLFILINLPMYSASWEIDNFIEVEDERVIVLKKGKNYYTLENKLNSIVFSEISNQTKRTYVIDSNFKYTLYGFDINSNHLIYNDYKNFYYYNYLEKELIAKVDIIPSDYIEFNHDNINVFASNLSTQNCNTETKTLFQEFNIPNRTKVLYNLPDPKGVDLTCFSRRKVITPLDTLIGISQVSEYKIKFFDRSFNLIDSIVSSDSNWEQYYEEIPKFDCHSQIVEHINRTRDIIYNFSQIWLFNKLSDSIVFISWGTGTTTNGNTKFDYYHDTWKKVDDGWKLIETLDQTKLSKNDVFDFLSIELNESYYIRNGYLYIIKPYPIELVSEYYKKSKIEFDKELNKYYISNNLRYTCFIYKYVP